MLDQVKMKKIQAELEQKKHKQKGATMIEYALVVAAIVGIGVYFFGSNGTLSGAINTKLGNVVTDIKNS